MVVTNDEKLAEKVKMVANHGSRIRYHHDLLGVNSRLDTIQAAILRVKLKYLAKWNETRKQVANYYSNGLNGLSVTTPFVADYAEHIFHQYTIKLAERDALQQFLNDKKIPNSVHYPIPLHLQAAYKKISGYNKGDFPVSEDSAQRVISLPMHPDLTQEEQDYVIGSIHEFYRK